MTFDRNSIIDEIKEMLSSDRFEHTLGVEAEAVALAKKHNENVERASLAALLHDCGRALTKTELRNAARRAKLVDPILYLQPHLLHAPIGAQIARERFGVDDGEILNAIARHTLGSADMSMLDRIIYLADAIEPAREWPDVEAIRALSDADLDAALRWALDDSIRFVLEKGWLLHPSTIEARNSLIRPEKTELYELPWE